MEPGATWVVHPAAWTLMSPSVARPPCPCPVSLTVVSPSSACQLSQTKAGSGHQGPEVASCIDTSDRLTMSSSLSPLPVSSSSPCYTTSLTGTPRTQARQGDFVCVECGKSFHQPSQLRAHLRAHTGISALCRGTGQCQECMCGWGGVEGIFWLHFGVVTNAMTKSSSERKGFIWLVLLGHGLSLRVVRASS